MSDKELQIFELCEKLAELLGDKEAIANLKLLYEHHPEMFKDMQDVSLVIEEVVKSPDLIMKNPKSKNQQDYIVAKKLNEKDMGDIGIRNDEDINLIFHANKKRIRDFRRLERVKAKIEANGGDALSLHTPSQAWMGANVVSSTLSSTSNQTIPNPSQKSQIQSEEEKLIAKMLKTQDELNAMPRAKDFAREFEKDLEQSFKVKLSEDNLKKDDENKSKLRLNKQ